MNVDGIRKTIHQVNQIAYRPKLLSKIASGYFNTLVRGKSVLRVCEFSINWACQSKCEFCYAAKFRKPGQELLSYEEICDTWEQAKKLGAFSAILFGGEPLLHPRFLDIVAAMEPRKHLITFTTNAIALDEPLVKELKRLGVFLINLSLNSMDPAVNDGLRGYSGHFDKAMQAIEMCDKHKMQVYLPVATARPYWKETLEIVDFAMARDLGVTINLMSPMGRSEGASEELFDEDFWHDLRTLYNRHPKLRSDYDVNLNPKVCCPAGHEKVHVAPFGDVTGCSMNPVSFGNVRQNSLQEIVTKMRGFKYFAKREPHCLVAVNKDFIGNYMDYAVNFPSSPYRVEENPHYPADALLN